MKLKQLLENWGLTGLKLNAGFVEMDWAPQDPDRNAAWELHVELLTRIATQPLHESHGTEQAALKSLHGLFEITRETLKRHGKYCTQFAKIAIPVLNQVIRPFTAKWHGLSEKKCFDDPAQCKQFREELAALRIVLQKYSAALAQIAGVEDLTKLESST